MQGTVVLNHRLAALWSHKFCSINFYTWLAVWFTGGFILMGRAHFIYKCNYFADCWKCGRACQCYYVCSQRQTGKFYVDSALAWQLYVFVDGFHFRLCFNVEHHCLAGYLFRCCNWIFHSDLNVCGKQPPWYIMLPQLLLWSGRQWFKVFNEEHISDIVIYGYADSFLCCHWVAHGNKHGPELWTLWDSISFHNCSCCGFHGSGQCLDTYRKPTCVLWLVLRSPQLHQSCKIICVVT